MLSPLKAPSMTFSAENPASQLQLFLFLLRPTLKNQAAGVFGRLSPQAERDDLSYSKS